VYHITDVPTVLSGVSMIAMDPQELCGLPHNRVGLTLKFVQLARDGRALPESYPDQFQPYTFPAFRHVPASDMRTKYEGTMFRLPLRTGEQARAARERAAVSGRWLSTDEATPESIWTALSTVRDPVADRSQSLHALCALTA
jgi:hypothetical protein